MREAMNWSSDIVCAPWARVGEILGDGLVEFVARDLAVVVEVELAEEAVGEAAAIGLGRFARQLWLARFAHLGQGHARAHDHRRTQKQSIAKCVFHRSNPLVMLPFAGDEYFRARPETVLGRAELVTKFR